MTMISESELSLLMVCAVASTKEIGAIIITSSGISRPVMPIKTNSVCRWLVIRSNSRIACVNHITTVRLTRVITNAAIVARNMYRPIDPIGLNFPADGPYWPPPAPPRCRQTPLQPGSPSAANFMLSQNGLAKAKPLKLQSEGLLKVNDLPTHGWGCTRASCATATSLNILGTPARSGSYVGNKKLALA